MQQARLGFAKSPCWRVNFDQAPIAQGIEHRPPEAGAQVRILLGALSGLQKISELLHCQRSV
jgi:hypothetical protein